MFYSYYIHQEKKSDKERKIERKTLSFLHTKRFDTFILRWVQFLVGAIPRPPFFNQPKFNLYKFNRRLCVVYKNTKIFAHFGLWPIVGRQVEEYRPIISFLIPITKTSSLISIRNIHDMIKNAIRNVLCSILEIPKKRYWYFDGFIKA